MNDTNVFFVFNPNGTSPRVKHSSFEDAKNEAHRLATANPGEEFMVLEPSYAIKRVPQYITEERTFNISH